MATVKLRYCPAMHSDKDGVLIYQIIHNCNIKRLKSKYRIFNCEWNKETECIMKQPPDAPRYDIVNQIIRNVQWEIKQLTGIADRLAYTQCSFTTDDIIAEFQKREVGPSVFHFFHEESERLLRLGRVRAGESCKAALNSLMHFRNDEDLTFDMMDSDMMESYEAYLKGRGVVRNTVSYYMRSLRSVYNRAIERGIATDCQPFRHVYTSKDRTVKRALRLEDIKKIRNLDLTGHPPLEFSRDMFLFSFYTRGMPFIDMAFLRKKDLQGNTLCYRRRKTGQMLQIEWLPFMQDIVNKYCVNPTQYLLPIITKSERNDRRQYLNKLRAVNRNLKQVAEMAKVSVPLTCYYARHSWASLARNMNVPISVISEALGHDNEATTRIYLDSIQSTMVDSANRKILSKLLKHDKGI